MKANRLHWLARLLSVALLAGVATGYSADGDFHAVKTVSTALPGGRFEIVQSTIVARDTFRLDKALGRVWQRVKTEDGDTEWQEILVENSIRITTPSSLRFQLILSGIAARDTFLFDSQTGRTWLLTSITDEGKEPGKMWLEVLNSKWPAPTHPFDKVKPGPAPAPTASEPISLSPHPGTILPPNEVK